MSTHINLNKVCGPRAWWFSASDVLPFQFPKGMWKVPLLLKAILYHLQLWGIGLQWHDLIHIFIDNGLAHLKRQK
jgi:hypothetical protein